MKYWRDFISEELGERNEEYQYVFFQKAFIGKYVDIQGKAIQ
jgi:hypothetical protein